MSNERSEHMERRLRLELTAAAQMAPPFPGVDRVHQESLDGGPRRFGREPVVWVTLIAVGLLGLYGLGRWPIDRGAERGAVAIDVSSDQVEDEGSSPGADAAALDDALAKIDDWATTPGWAGSIVHADGRAITILWAGPIPPQVASLDGTEIDGVPISVESADYSMEQLQAAALKLTADAAQAGVHIAGTGPNLSRSGLEVLVNRAKSKATIKDAYDALVLLQPLTDVPIVDISFGGGVGMWPAPLPD